MIDYVRVTDVLKKYNGLEDIPKHVLEHAADRGKRIHKYCELYANQMLFGTIDNDCMPYIDAFQTWYDHNVEQVLTTEERLYCRLHEITGQIDLVAKLKGDSAFSLIDIKSSSKPSKTWNIQTAAYQWLAYVNDIKVDKRFSLQLKKNGTSHFIEYKNYEEEFSVFVSLLNVYRFFS